MTYQEVVQQVYAMNKQAALDKQAYLNKQAFIGGLISLLRAAPKALPGALKVGRGVLQAGKNFRQSLGGFAGKGRYIDDMMEGLRQGKGYIGRYLSNLGKGFKGLVTGKAGNIVDDAQKLGKRTLMQGTRLKNRGIAEAKNIADDVITRGYVYGDDALKAAKKGAGKVWDAVKLPLNTATAAGVGAYAANKLSKDDK